MYVLDLFPRPIAGLFGVALLTLLAVLGCGGLKSTAGPSTIDHTDVSEALRHETEERWGEAHRARNGSWDCSAFVQHTYAQVFGLTLPRATAQQVKIGTKVRRKELQAGDLVFFRPSAKTRHVGFYLGNGEFGHVSSSQGVTISRLDEPYWQKRYWTARRVLDNQTTPAAATHTGW